MPCWLPLLQWVQTPSFLGVQALLWSEYKHHCTFKLLAARTPNCAIPWVLQGYGKKITNIYIVKDSGFRDILEPYNTVMVDCGFKIKYYLTFVDVKGN